MVKRIGPAALAGLLLALVFEPVALPWLMPLALAGFALSLHGLRARHAWVPGLAFGAVFYLVHIYWLRGSIGQAPWLALSAVEALFYAALGPVAVVLRRLPWWPVWTAAAWTAVEGLRSGWPFSGLPWGRLAYGVVDTPVAPALAYVGTTGVTFLMALLGFLLAAAVVARPGRDRVLAGGLVVGLAALTCLPSLVPFRLDRTGESTVAVVQGDVPGAGDDVLHDVLQLTENHVQATVDLADRVRAGEAPAPDFVLWPENSTATDPFRPGPVNAGLRRAAAAIGVPVVVGGLVDAGPEHILNQGIVWDPVTGAGDRYTKWHPVAYGEYIPWRGLVRRLGLEERGQLARIPRDMLSGARTTPLRVGDLLVADAICFDIAYDDGLHAQVRGGAQLMTVQTSNASFIFTDQIDQQFAITRLRAIEAGRWLAVASTNGLSGVIDPDGTVVAQAEPQTTTVLVEQVDLVEGLTPAVWLGAWPARVLAALTLLGLGLGLVTYRRDGDSSRRSPITDDVDSRPGERQPA